MQGSGRPNKLLNKRARRAGKGKATGKAVDRRT